MRVRRVCRLNLNKLETQFQTADVRLFFSPFTSEMAQHQGGGAWLSDLVYCLFNSHGLNVVCAQRSQVKQLEGEAFRGHCYYHRKTNIIVTNRLERHFLLPASCFLVASMTGLFTVPCVLCDVTVQEDPVREGDGFCGSL